MGFFHWLRESFRSTEWLEQNGKVAYGTVSLNYGTYHSEDYRRPPGGSNSYCTIRVSFINPVTGQSDTWGMDGDNRTVRLYNLYNGKSVRVYVHPENYGTTVKLD